MPVKRVGLIGNPVEHSRSPRMQNAAFAALGMDADHVYELWHTEDDEVAARVASIRDADIAGANVTVPHKQAVMPYLDEISEAARRIGAVNTIILLISSWNVAVAVRAAQLGQKMFMAFNLFFASLCGIAFLVIKIALEYVPKIQQGEIPGAKFTYAHATSAYDPIFLSVYWVSTFTHGVHVLIGVFLLWWIGWRALKGHFGPRYYTPVENVGLYWHLVDLIWIFLFPLLYLVP